MFVKLAWKEPLILNANKYSVARPGLAARLGCYPWYMYYCRDKCAAAVALSGLGAIVSRVECIASSPRDKTRAVLVPNNAFSVAMYSCIGSSA